MQQLPDGQERSRKADISSSLHGPIIHIGYHKTATTWFQDCFYPAVRNRSYRSRAVARAAFLDHGALHFDPDRALAILGEDHARLILCEESLSGGLHNGGLAGNLSKDVAARIKTTLPNAQIVIFVREQCSAIAATYIQYVKGGGTHRPRRYFFGHERLRPSAPERDEAPGFRWEHFDYARLIAHYDALFGRDRVHVFRYEDFRADPQAFAARYAARLGLDVDLNELDFATRNPSLSRLLLAFARIANLFTRRAVTDKNCLIHLPGWYWLSRKLLRKANGSGLFGRSLGMWDILDDAMVARFRALYRSGNDVLARRLRSEVVAISQNAPTSLAAYRNSAN